MLSSLIASSPIILLIALTFISKKGFLASVVLSLSLLIAISLFFWEISFFVIMASSVKGALISFEIIAIIFGALLIFGIFKKLGGEASVKSIFDEIFIDNRVKAVFIAWPFVSFLEGISGFGTPMMIVIPILIAAGFKPINAIIISLIGGAFSVIFGAVGLPVTYGLVSTVGENLASLSAVIISALNIVLAPIIVSAVFFISLFKKGESKNSLFYDLWQNFSFIIFSSLSVSLPSFITLIFLGPELPSIIGGVSGMIFVFLYAIFQKLNKEKRFDINLDKIKKDFVAFVPYAAITFALILTRISYIRNWLSGIFQINIISILGTEISHIIRPFVLSSMMFFIVAAIFATFFIFRGHKNYIAEIFIDSAKRIIHPAMILICVLVFTQIMLNSGFNHSELPSMVVSAANIFYGFNQTSVLFISPFIGALGAFITGSSTVSNLLFASIQQSIAVFSGNTEAIIIAMQGIGSAAGNMISIHNIVAALVMAQFVLQSNNNLNKTNFDFILMEKKILKLNLSFLAAYLFLAAFLGFIFVAFNWI